MRILGTLRGNHASVKPTPGPRPARKADPMNGNQAIRRHVEADLALGILARAVDPRQTPADLADRMADLATVHFLAAARIAFGQTVCPGCSHVGELTDDPQVLKCTGCGGVFTDGQAITWAQALKFVALHLAMLPNAGDEGSFLFDLDVFDVILADGKTTNRLHGWADKRTKRVVQWG